MTRLPLSPLQIELIERHRQQSSGRMMVTTAHDRMPSARTGLAADWTAQQERTAVEPQAFCGLDADAI